MSGYKQISMTHQQGTHGVCYRLLCTNLGDEILCTLSSNNNIHWENGVNYWWSTYALKSKKVSEMHFRAMLMCFCWYSDLVSHTHKQTHTNTHTHKDIQYTLWASRLTHPYKYIFTSPAMCSQLLSLLHWMYNSLLSKFYFPQCLLFSKIIHL